MRKKEKKNKKTETVERPVATTTVDLVLLQDAVRAFLPLFGYVAGQMLSNMMARKMLAGVEGKLQLEGQGTSKVTKQSGSRKKK